MIQAMKMRMVTRIVLMAMAGLLLMAQPSEASKPSKLSKPEIKSLFWKVAGLTRQWIKTVNRTSKVDHPKATRSLNRVAQITERKALQIRPGKCRTALEKMSFLYERIRDQMESLSERQTWARKIRHHVYEVFYRHKCANVDSRFYHE